MMLRDMLQTLFVGQDTQVEFFQQLCVWVAAWSCSLDRSFLFTACVISQSSVLVCSLEALGSASMNLTLCMLG